VKRCDRRFSGWADRLAAILLFCGLTPLLAQQATASPVVLNADETLDSGVFRLTWTGGTPPYTAYKFFTPMICGAQAFATTGTSFSLPVLATDTLTFYNISDSSAPGASIAISTPTVGTVVTTPNVDVTGSVTPPDTPVCVNNVPAVVTGNTFSITGTLLALGSNDIRVNATVPSGNVAFTTRTITRNAANTPPTVTITTPTDACSPTPRISFTASDNAGLDQTRLRLVLNGAVSSGVVIDSSTATSLSAHVNLNQLTPGTQVVRVTIPDNSGATGAATATWTYSGPKITSISPRAALPGATLTINGCGFSTTTFQNLVEFGSAVVVAFPSSATTTQLHVTIPNGAADGPVSVLVSTIQTNGIPLDIQISRLNNIDLFIAVDADGYMYTDGFADSGDPNHPYAVIYKTTPDGSQSGVLVQFGTTTDVTGLSFDPTRTTLYVTTVEDRLPVQDIPYRDVPSNLQPNFGTPQCSLSHTSCPCTGAGNVCQQPRFLFYDSNLWAFDRNGSPLGNPGVFPGGGQFSVLNGVTADANYVYFGAYDGINWVMSVLRAPRSGGASAVLANFGLSYAYFYDMSSSSGGNVHVSYGRADLLSADDVKIFTMNQLGTPLWNYGRAGEDLTGVVVDCRNQLYLASDTTNNVYELNPSGGFVATRSTTEQFPLLLDLDRNGNLYTNSYDTVAQVAYINRSAFRDTACADDFRIVLSGDNPKIVADTNASGVETSNTQVAVLQAVFQPHGGGTGDSPVFPVGTVVHWSCVDVDDPADSPLVDPVSTYDNAGGFDSSPVFTAEAGYGAGGTVLDCRSGSSTTTNIILNGAIPTTKVQFHPSDAPGDNFLVTISIQVPRATGTVTQIANSQVMTVWKRLRIEADSMGYNTGPPDLDDDDAFIGDMPDPDTSMMVLALRQAYIDVITTGTGARTNVTFDPHVPDMWLHLPGEVPEVRAQGSLGRDLATNTGAWGVYIQGGYDGSVNKDFDPPEEGWLLGVSDLGLYSLIFPEPMRDLSVSGLAGGGGCPQHPWDEQYLRRAVLLHEILHEFKVFDLLQNTCDGSNGVLESDVQYPYYIGDQLRSIRTVTYPGAP
jgi:hypothetical protein